MTSSKAGKGRTCARAVAVAAPFAIALALGGRAALPPAPAEGIETLTVHLASSGAYPERVRSVPISRRPRSQPRVVMSLGPGKLKTLRSGDRVDTRAEVEVSTTCLEWMRKCVGRRYLFSPRVAARLVLARGAHRAKGPLTRPLTGWRRRTCSQKLPARNHHCVLTIPRAGRLVRNASRLPCRNCHVSLVVSANHPRAKRGQRLVIGADDHRGVAQNKGQLAATVYRPRAARELAITRKSTEAQVRRLPMGPNRSGAARRRVVYSVRLGGLRAGESLVIDGRMVGKIKHLSYNALVQSRLILATHPTSRVRTWRAKQIGGHHGLVGPQNGFNCTQGRSGHRDPCVVRKTGVMRIVRDAREHPVKGTGDRIPMYVNLIVGTRATGVQSHRRRARHRMRVRPRKGFVRVERYGPELAR